MGEAITNSSYCQGQRIIDELQKLHNFNMLLAAKREGAEHAL